MSDYWFWQRYDAMHYALYGGDMEDPSTWRRADKIVTDAYAEWFRRHEQGAVGLSIGRYITDQLRAAGYVNDDAEEAIGWAGARGHCDCGLRAGHDGNHAPHVHTADCRCGGEWTAPNKLAERTQATIDRAVAEGKLPG